MDVIADSCALPCMSWPRTVVLSIGIFSTSTYKLHNWQQYLYSWRCFRRFSNKDISFQNLTRSFDNYLKNCTTGNWPRCLNICVSLPYNPCSIYQWGRPSNTFTSFPNPSADAACSAPHLVRSSLTKQMSLLQIIRISPSMSSSKFVFRKTWLLLT